MLWFSLNDLDFCKDYNLVQISENAQKQNITSANQTLLFKELTARGLKLKQPSPSLSVFEDDTFFSIEDEEEEDFDSEENVEEGDKGVLD